MKQKILALTLIFLFIGCTTSQTNNTISKKYLTEEDKIKAVRDHGFNIKNIKNPSENLQIEAVWDSPYSIQYIDNPTEKTSLEAVKILGLVIKYIKNPTEQVKLAAVKQNGVNLQYIKNPSEVVKLAAVKQNGVSLEYIKNPTRKVIETALKSNPDALNYIVKPTIKDKLLAYGKIEVNASQLNYNKKNNHIRIEINNNQLHITNLTSKFLTINYIVGYFDTKINNYKFSTLPPETSLTRPLHKHKIKILSLDNLNKKISYGFAIQYQFSSDKKVYEFYKLEKHKLSNLVNLN